MTPEERRQRILEWHRVKTRAAWRLECGMYWSFAAAFVIVLTAMIVSMLV